MILQRLDETNRHYFDAAFSLYQSAFPPEERRDMNEQQRVLDLPDYHFDLILEGDTLYGVMLYWETADLIFLEHFTTIPHIRGKGVGAGALSLLKAKGKTVLLEIEPPADEITNRRYEFYKHNGFVMNPYHHIQAKYHLGDEDLELKVLSYPAVLSPELYRSFYEYMTRQIGIQPNLAKDITIRGLQDGDDLMQIARLIYLTDPYIYPAWFDSIQQAQLVLSQMIQLPTLYRKENLTLAISADGHVAGVAVACQTPFTESEAVIHQAFAQAGVVCDSRTHQIFNDYYAKMGHPEDGYYLSNIAIDPQYRKQGIAAALLKHIIEGRPLCTLECVIANIGSWRLYQRLGFKIAYEYPGVFDVPCYKMIYRR